MVKFGQRLTRGVAYGFVLGFVLGMLGYLIATAINAMAGSSVVNSTAFLLFGVATGSGASIAIELSKEIDE